MFILVFPDLLQFTKVLSKTLNISIFQGSFLRQALPRASVILTYMAFRMSPAVRPSLQQGLMASRLTRKYIKRCPSFHLFCIQ